MRLILTFTLLLLSTSFQRADYIANPQSISVSNSVSLIVLGNVQDAGSPQIGCTKKCCQELLKHPVSDRFVTSLGLIDEENHKNYLFEATPDIAEQLRVLKKRSPFATKETPDGIFLTHAHIGHYSGLMFLGREAMNASQVPVYTMPKMKSFLEKNGPWSQLISLNNITPQLIEQNQPVSLTSNITVTPFLVPHRDEFSETVGYMIKGPHKSALFIPDIDKWEKWGTSIIDVISKVDYAFIDATFYDEKEINNRKISEIPHPFIIESISLFKNMDLKNREKIHFIHFNHTNPALDKRSKQSKYILENGFRIARFNDTFTL